MTDGHRKRHRSRWMHFSAKTRIIVDWVRIIIGLAIYSFGVYLCEILLWAVVTLIGWALGGSVGIGTVLSVFGAGAVMHLFYSMIHFEPRAWHHRSISEMLRGRYFIKHHLRLLIYLPQ